MTHFRKIARLLLLVLPLLAATLACNALSGPAGPGPSVAPLTQAAATLTAAANRAATALAATVPGATLTAGPISTQAPTPASTPTAASPTPAAASPTAAGSPASATTVALDPCALLTVAEAQSLTGVPMRAPKSQSGACLIADAATGIGSGVALYALPPSQSQAFFNQFVPSLKQSGVNVDAALAARLTADSAAGDTVASVHDLITMTVGQAKFNARQVDGLGSAALWTWNKVTTSQEGVLVAAQPGAVVALALIADPTIQETAAQPAMQQIVSRTLTGLPASFMVPGLQVAGSAPAIDPCSLASASDIDPILGIQAEAGAANQGSCNFLDVATHKLSVRVFALPAGDAASNAFLGASELVLVGNSAAQDKINADLAAGDLVAAVTDMGAALKSGPNNYLLIPQGLGDSALLLIERLGSHRISYFLAARPGVLVGVEGSLAPGDDAATSALARALLTRILAGLPAKFIVNGVP